VRKSAVFVGCAATVWATGCQDQAFKEVNKEPTAEIFSPIQDEEIKEGVFFLASGAVSDRDDPIDQLRITWILNGEVKCPESTPMGDGRTECGMSIGQIDSEISLFVLDPNEASYQSSVSVIALPATGPTVNISEPSESQYVVGEKIAFEGTVSDGEDAASALRVWWWSDLDDELDIDLAVDDDGSVVGYYDGLSVGTHVLRLWAEDTSGRANSSEVVVGILPEPAPPTAAITAPEDDSTHASGSAVLFQATIGDETTPVTDLSIQWTSTLDGVLNTDATDDFGTATFVHEDLSEGTHEIILTVVDGDGMTNTERVTITVTAESDPGGEDTASEG